MQTALEKAMALILSADAELLDIGFDIFDNDYTSIFAFFIINFIISG